MADTVTSMDDMDWLLSSAGDQHEHENRTVTPNKRHRSSSAAREMLLQRTPKRVRASPGVRSRSCAASKRTHGGWLELADPMSVNKGSSCAMSVRSAPSSP